MHEQQQPTQVSIPRRTYTEEEQLLRWTLIIEAILRDKPRELAQVHQIVTPMLSPKSQEAS